VELYLRLHGPTPRLQSGTYEVPPHSSAREVLDQLISGRVVLESLTVVEGWSFAQMRARWMRIRRWRTSCADCRRSS
jgi:UPF0755 protein